MTNIVNIIVNRENAVVQNHAFTGERAVISKRAEQIFIELVKQHDTATEEEIEAALDDGLWETSDGTTICLTWANE